MFSCAAFTYKNVIRSRPVSWYSSLDCFLSLLFCSSSVFAGVPICRHLFHPLRGSSRAWFVRSWPRRTPFRVLHCPLRRQKREPGGVFLCAARVLFVVIIRRGSRKKFPRLKEQKRRKKNVRPPHSFNTGFFVFERVVALCFECIFGISLVVVWMLALLWQNKKWAAAVGEIRKLSVASS